jgi:hypothetical protein
MCAGRRRSNLATERTEITEYSNIQILGSLRDCFVTTHPRALLCSSQWTANIDERIFIKPIFTTLQKTHYHKTFFCLFGYTVVIWIEVDENGTIGGYINLILLLTWEAGAQFLRSRWEANGKQVGSFCAVFAQQVRSFQRVWRVAVRVK